MSNAKNIRDKISSIRKTKKITKAMEMVAASKMRNAQRLMETSKPFAKKIREVILHLAHGRPEYQHAFVKKREIKRVGYMVVSTDRGLCGGLNSNLFRKTLKEMQSWQAQSIPVDLCLVGKKAEGFFKRFGEIKAVLSHLGDAPSLHDLIGGVKVMLDAYQAESLDAFYIVYNEFVSRMNQKPVVQQLLPLPENEGEELPYSWDYIYEPDAKQLLDVLLTRYIETQVYQSVVENKACEQAARMLAMKSASDNAQEITDELQLVYNKARQAAITQEISEIVSGAEAV